MTGRLNTRAPTTGSGLDMDQSGAFCIVCASPPPLTTERLCEVCFRKRNHLSDLPERIQQTRCPTCLKIQIEGRFSRVSEEDLMQQRIIEALRVHPEAQDVEMDLHAESIDERTTRLNLELRGSIQGFVFESLHETLLQTSNGVCLPCTRKAGAYFEATMQLRSAGRRLDEKEIADLRASLDTMLEEIGDEPMFFITNEGPVKGGWDMQVGSKAMARMWAKKLVSAHGGRIKETSSVVGHKDGVDITRLTVLYRKPAYTLGDVIGFSGRMWRVDTWTKDGPILKALDNLERTGTTWRSLEKCTVLSRMQEHYTVEILRRDGSAFDFMDPNDYTMRTIGNPYDLEEEASSVRICLIDGEWQSLPRVRADGVD